MKRSRPAPRHEPSSSHRVVAAPRDGNDERFHVETLRQPVEWRRNDPPDDGDDEGISNL